MSRVSISLVVMGSKSINLGKGNIVSKTFQPNNDSSCDLSDSVSDGSSQLIDSFETYYTTSLSSLNLTVTLQATDQSVGDTFTISGKVDNTYTLQSSSPDSDDEAQITISTGNGLTKQSINTNNNTCSAQMKAEKKGGRSEVDISVKTQMTEESVSKTVNVKESFNQLTSSPNHTILNSTPSSGCSNTIDTTNFDTAVVTVAGAEGGDATSELGGNGGKIKIVSDISSVDELCYGVAEKGDDHDRGSFDFDAYARGGIGFNTGGEPNPRTGSDNAGGGGGGGGSEISRGFLSPDIAQNGGDGADGITNVGGIGGANKFDDGRPGVGKAGLLAERTVSTGTSLGDGKVIIELYRESL